MKTQTVEDKVQQFLEKKFRTSRSFATKDGYRWPKLRKLPISKKNPVRHWKGKCPKCGKVWTQNHPD